MDKNVTNIKKKNNSEISKTLKILSQRNNNNVIIPNKNIDINPKSKNPTIVLNKPSNNFFRNNTKTLSNNNLNIKNISKNIPTINKNKEKIKDTNTKTPSLPSFKRINTPNKLQITRKTSGIINNKKIYNEQKNKEKKIISYRIESQGKPLNIKRNNTAINSKNSIKNKNIEKEKNNETIINEIKNINKEQTDKFTVYHFFKTNNLFLFIKNSKYNPNNEQFKPNSNFELIEEYTLPQAYRPRMNFFGNIPKCILEACNKGNISMIKNFENCNIVWKLLHPEKMRVLIRHLSKYQKYNHFPCTYQLGRKDNLYKHYKYYKRLAPDLFNYMPSTYILPMDINNFESELKKNKKYIWIVKPVNKSRGRGIHLICNENDYTKLYKKPKNNKDIKVLDNNLQLLISRYLDKPHLLNNKKYDLRIYVLVGSFTPLKIYLYYNGLVRFATENYEKGNYDNVFIHLTNYSINKNNPNYKSNLKNNKEIDDLDEIEEDIEQDDDSSKWYLVEYKNYFKKDINIFEKIWKQIEDIVIKTLLTVFEFNCREISGNKNNNLFELYGFDIFIDESFRAWLLEVNVNPSLHCTSPLDLSIKTDLIIDIFNLVGIAPFNHNNNDELYDFLKKKNDKNDNKNKEIKLPKIINNNSNDNKNSNLINKKLKIEKNFNQNNLKMKLPEYDDDYYKNMIIMFQEERLRAETTGFSLIFPKKDNIEYYSNILDKNNCANDANIVLWEYILNNE